MSSSVPVFSNGDFSNEVLSAQEKARREADYDQLLKDNRQADLTIGFILDEDAGLVEGKAITKTVTVEKDRFRGALTYTIEKANGFVDFNTVQYRITKLDNQAGGDKANILCDVTTHPNPSTRSGKSPDACWQDGQPHSWGINLKPPITAGSTYFHIRCYFTFDSPGNDPKANNHQDTLHTDY